jgi:hypothetical protein
MLKAEMFKITSNQMLELSSSLNSGLEKQKTVFDKLNYSPYDDDGDDEFGGTYYAIAMHEENYKAAADNIKAEPYYHLICDEIRDKEITSGASLTKEEQEAIDKEIFKDDDTVMVMSNLSDGKSSIVCLTVQQSQGQESVSHLHDTGC